MKCLVVCYLFVICYIQFVYNLKSNLLSRKLKNFNNTGKTYAFLKQEKNIFSEIEELIKDNMIIEVKL